MVTYLMTGKKEYWSCTKMDTSLRLLLWIDPNFRLLFKLPDSSME
jgi:hypothetical protein